MRCVCRTVVSREIQSSEALHKLRVNATERRSFKLRSARKPSNSRLKSGIRILVVKNLATIYPWHGISQSICSARSEGRQRSCQKPQLQRLGDGREPQRGRKASYEPRAVRMHSPLRRQYTHTWPLRLCHVSALKVEPDTSSKVVALMQDIEPMPSGARSSTKTKRADLGK